MLKIKKRKYLIHAFIFFTFVASVFLSVYIKNYNKSDIAKYNYEKAINSPIMSQKDFCFSLVQPPGGMVFYHALFYFSFILIVMSIILILNMYITAFIKMSIRDKLIFAIAMSLVFFACLKFIFNLSFVVLVAIALSILLFSKLKISFRDKYLYLSTSFIVALSCFMLLGAWFDTDPQFYNCARFFY